MTDDAIRDALAFYGITRANWLGVGIETFNLGEEPKPYSAEIVLRFVEDGSTVTARESVDGWYRSDFSAARAAEREAHRWWSVLVRGVHDRSDSARTTRESVTHTAPSERSLRSMTDRGDR